MCLACNPRFLPGLDIDTLAPPAGDGRLALHLPDGMGGATLSQLFPDGDAPLAGRARRVPAPPTSGYGMPGALPRVLDDAFVAAAVEAYRHYWAAMLDGRLADGTRYQLTLATPYTALSGVLPEADVVAALPAAEAVASTALARLLKSLPAERLALQWDVAAEVHVWETRGRTLNAPRGLPERLLESLAALSGGLPAELSVGFRLGRPTGEAPSADCGQATRLLGAIVATADRLPDFVYLPVPAEAPESWYEPLANLTLFPDTEVALGLVHDEPDAADRALGRLAAAHAFLPGAGLAPAPGVDPARLLPVFTQLLAADDSTGGR
jgi:hypothetical protein